MLVQIKKHEFKKCRQSGFCVRQRAYSDLVDLKKEPTPYKILRETVSVQKDNGVLTCEVLNQLSNIKYNFKLEALENQTVRIRLEEKDPKKKQYASVGNFSLVEEPKSTPFKTFVKAKSETEFSILEFGKNAKMLLQENPLLLTLKVNEVSVFTFNEKGYLHYEHHREKATVKNSEEPALKNEDSPGMEEVLAEELSEKEKLEKELKEKLEFGMWEESFEGNTDSKKYGPSSIGIDITFSGIEHVYGIPEHASSFNLKNTRGNDVAYSEPYRLYNFDVFEYILDSPMGLYGSIPFMMGHKKGNTVGMFWMNSAEMWVDIEREVELKTRAKQTVTHWSAESGILDLFVMLGPTPREVSSQYTSLTGKPALPQLFAIAYHQCRWNYNDEADVKEVNAKFDEYEIPYDVLWLDIEHTDGKKYFTWDEMVTIIDPHLKKDDNYYVSKEAKALDLFVKNKDGGDFEGWCWPGNSQWLDYTDPKARKFWAEQFKFESYKGSTSSLYTWNDMNEPSVFSGPETTMPKDNIHYEGWEHRDVHNVYGMLQQRATFEGHLLRSSNLDRPFVLSRAFFLGTQRYGAIWTGDNFAKWDHMEASVPMLLTIGVSGVTFSGADVGGFFGNPDPLLLLRWYQLAAFQPFFRAHAHIDTKRREPWIFGEPYTTLIRNAIRSRYRILPYLYTLNFEANQHGWPVMRPMMYEFPEDYFVYDMGDQYMLGDTILVKAVVNETSPSVKVYLPQGKWYDYTEYNAIDRPKDGLINYDTPTDKIPIFLRGGSILTRRERMRRSSSLMKRDPYTFYIALDDLELASGKIYTDDGHTFNHLKGSYIYSEFEFKINGNSGKLSSKNLLVKEFGASKVTKNYFKNQDVDFGGRLERIVIFGFKKPNFKLVEVKVENKILSFKKEKNEVFVIKDPAVFIGEEWEISFKFE
ncbi:hypothetical protein HDU92_009129 [Lobulomyces angularis]|nr:hypothetical protein HDU92_009129 [Lobulomyces angularis]